MIRKLSCVLLLASQKVTNIAAFSSRTTASSFTSSNKILSRNLSRPNLPNQHRRSFANTNVALKMTSSSKEADADANLVHSRDVDAVYNAPVADGKRRAINSTVEFLITAMVGVPLFLTVVLPLSAVFQVGKKVLPVAESVPSVTDANANAKDVLEVEADSFPPISELTPLAERKYDAVLLGATGFTGGIAAKYMAQQYGCGKELKWAIAGRSQKKLDAIRQEIVNLGFAPAVDSIDTILVDTSQPSTVHGLVKDTRSIITTAGPFCKYGSNVVAFCARYGTNYADITGETGWNKEMIVKYEDLAKETGAKIVSLCGNDSIPWDMTTFKLRQLMSKECKDTISKVKCYDQFKGGISGGTIDTMLTMVDGKYVEPRFEFDPYLRTRDGKKSMNKSKNASSQLMTKSDTLGGHGEWTSPFVMAAVNGEVVKRSQALSEGGNGTGSGSTLTYEEYVVNPSFKEAFLGWFGPILGLTALLNPITGVPMRKFLLPKPGDGPTEKQREYGYLLVSGVGEGQNGSLVRSEFYFPGDPGYKETAKMVVESGLCLALEGDRLPEQGGGFFTPSVAMGDILLERLCKTGCKFASKVVRMPKLKSNL